jgi:hypothetical protein
MAVTIIPHSLRVGTKIGGGGTATVAMAFSYRRKTREMINMKCKTVVLFRILSFRWMSYLLLNILYNPAIPSIMAVTIIPHSPSVGTVNDGAGPLPE